MAEELLEQVIMTFPSNSMYIIESEDEDHNILLTNNNNVVTFMKVGKNVTIDNITLVKAPMIEATDAVKVDSGCSTCNKDNSGS